MNLIAIVSINAKEYGTLIFVKAKSKSRAVVVIVNITAAKINTKNLAVNKRPPVKAPIVGPSRIMYRIMYAIGRKITKNFVLLQIKFNGRFATKIRNKVNAKIPVIMYTLEVMNTTAEKLTNQSNFVLGSNLCISELPGIYS
jgi:hypothetical protein